MAEAEFRHVVTASFRAGKTSSVARSLWQWDYGIVLRFDGISLPEAYEVHFSNSATGGDAVSQTGTSDGVVVPNIMFESGKPVYAFVYLHDDLDDGETAYTAVIPVHERPKPNYDEVTPEQQSAFEIMYAQMEKAIRAESVRVSAEEDRLQREEDRIAAEEARISAEVIRVQNEAERISGEAERVSAELEREDNEDARLSGETMRIASEGDRLAAEERRVEAEIERRDSEALRVSDEAERRTAEAQRISAEERRVSDENARQTNETARQAAEEAREALADELRGITANAITLEPGSAATADYNAGVITFGIPHGEKGDTGEQGPRGERGLQGVKGDTGPRGVRGDQGARGEKGDTGPAGPEGFSPIAYVTKEGNTSTIVVSDLYGITMTDVVDGVDGPPGPEGAAGPAGQDGVSPIITITDITGGHRVTITDATGAHSFDVMDGSEGQRGPAGKDGADGTDGHTPVITASKSGTITTISVDGTGVATINDGASGTDGDDGVTFTPAVSSAGVISWANDGGRQNPNPVDLTAGVSDAVSDWLDDHVDPATGYVVDDTLSVAGAAADAAKVGDLKSAIDVYGAANHAPISNGTYRPGSFTIVADGMGNYTINGSSTGSGLTHYDIYNNANAFPSGFGAGDELFLVHDCANSNIIFRLYERVGSSYSEIANIPGYGTKAVKLSANATGCIVRLSITNGASYTDVISKPIIMTTLTKQETDERLTENAYDVKHISPVNADNQYYYVKGYRFSGKTFISSTGIVDSNIRALCEITLNDGAIVYFDNSVYAGTYMIVDKATKKTLLVPNTGWNTTGKMIIDTNGMNNYVVLLQFKDKTNDSNNVDPANVDKCCYVIDRNRIVDLFLFAGQSNMAGRGVTNSTWPESYPHIIPSAGLEFRAITDKTRLYPMAEPFGKFENKTGGIDDGGSAPDGGNKTGGLAVAFVNEYYMHTGVPVIGISASEGGTGIQSWITGSENLTDALQRLSDAVTYLTNNGYTIRHKFMLWCQGESDTRLGVTGDQYKTYFDDIMVTMKNAGIEKCFLIRIGEFNGTDYDYSDIINAQTDIAQDRDDTVMATTILTSYKSRGLMKDQYHYYQAAYNEIGRYAGINVAEYVNSGKEPTMYDPKNNDLYFCHKN